MVSRNELQERYEEALFALFMMDMATEAGKKAWEENEQLKQNPNAAVPAELQARCKQTIRWQFRKKHLYSAGRFTLKSFGKIAMLVGILSMLFCGAVAASGAVRVTTLNVVMEIFPESTDFFVESRYTAETPPRLTVGWIPEGYGLTDTIESDTSIVYQYHKSNSEELQVMWIRAKGTRVSLDTEDAVTETILIGDMPVTQITKNDVTQLVWTTTDTSAFIWIIGVEVPLEHLIQVATNLQY